MIVLLKINLLKNIYVSQHSFVTFELCRESSWMLIEGSPPSSSGIGPACHDLIIEKSSWCWTCEKKGINLRTISKSAKILLRRVVLLHSYILSTLQVQNYVLRAFKLARKGHDPSTAKPARLHPLILVLLFAKCPTKQQTIKKWS